MISSMRKSVRSNHMPGRSPVLHSSSFCVLTLLLAIETRVRENISAHIGLDDARLFPCSNSRPYSLSSIVVIRADLTELLRQLPGCLRDFPQLTLVTAVK